MKNRKAKILLVRRNAPGVWQWVRLSNRRMGLMKYYGMMDCGFCKKPSAAQNRWKNHLRNKGGFCELPLCRLNDIFSRF